MEHNICMYCGKCCYDEELDIFDEEYERIKPYLKEPLERGEDGWIFMKGHGIPCPVLGDSGCKLTYELRPQICKVYPVIFKFFDRKKIQLDIELSISSECPHGKFFANLVNKQTIEEHMEMKREILKLGNMSLDDEKNGKWKK